MRALEAAVETARIHSGPQFGTRPDTPGLRKKRDFRVGEYLWRQGEECNKFYLIGSGEVAIGITIPHRGQQQVETAGSR